MSKHATNKANEAAGINHHCMRYSPAMAIHSGMRPQIHGWRWIIYTPNASGAAHAISLHSHGARIVVREKKSDRFADTGTPPHLLPWLWLTYCRPEHRPRTLLYNIELYKKNILYMLLFSYVYRKHYLRINFLINLKLILQKKEGKTGKLWYTFKYNIRSLLWRHEVFCMYCLVNSLS